MSCLTKMRGPPGKAVVEINGVRDEELASAGSNYYHLAKS